MARALYTRGMRLIGLRFAAAAAVFVATLPGCGGSDPDASTWEDLLFAWSVAKHVNGVEGDDAQDPQRRPRWRAEEEWQTSQQRGDRHEAGL